MSRIPPFIEPQLAGAADQVPEGQGWLFEIKLDGYRTLAGAAGRQVVCYSRTGLDWTHRFGDVPAAIAALELDRALLDGEIAMIDTKGRSSFPALQRALSAGGRGLVYFVFDLLMYAGKDLRSLPLAERKARLKWLLAKAKSPIFYSDHIEEKGPQFFAAACDQKLEGIIAKRADRPYRAGRGEDWRKIKCGLEQEFVVIGYTLSDRPGRLFSSLLLALNEGGELRHVGRVGTGFDQREMERVARLMVPLRREASPARRVLPGQKKRDLRWIEPKLVAQVRFTGWTADGVLRHPSYRGLREDKPARKVVRERARKIARV